MSRYGERIATATLVLVLSIAVYFGAVTAQQNTVLARAAAQQTKSTTAIIAEIRRDLTTHAEASASRDCGLAHLLELAVPHDSTVQSYVTKACQYTPPSQ